MNALKKLIPTLSEENRYKAQLQMLKLQKESNDLLLAIKENTSDIGEFNRPDSVKAITWYNYQTVKRKSMISITCQTVVYVPLENNYILNSVLV